MSTWHSTQNFFQDNDNYLGNQIKQGPIYQAQFHAVRYFPKGLWLAFNSNFYRGGESFQNGEPLLTDLEKRSAWRDVINPTCGASFN